jgi:hypothetical protein
MKLYRNKAYPFNQNKIFTLQHYASDAALWLFIILMFFLMFRMAKKLPLLIEGITGIFAVVILSVFIATVRLKKEIIMIGFEGDQFYIVTGHDHVFGRKSKSFPLAYANPKWEEEKLSVTYFDSILKIDPAQFENANDLIREFFNPETIVP